jgi:hypothetical protein
MYSGIEGFGIIKIIVNNMRKILLFLFFGLIISSFTGNSENHIVIQQDLKLAASIKNGKEIYTDMCMSCYFPNGKGKPKIYPPLA